MRYNSKKSNSQSDQTQDSKLNTKKNDSIPKKQNKKISQNKKKSLKILYEEKDLKYLYENWSVSFNRKKSDTLF